MAISKEEGSETRSSYLSLSIHLVMCHGSVEFVKFIKDSIDVCSSVSGLEPNLNKSTIFFGNVKIGDQRNILIVVPFKVGKAKIAWKTLCKPKCQGGLGFKELGKWNEVLLTKHVWNIATHKESLCVKWVHIVKLKDKAKQRIEYIVGNGNMTSAWYDKWNDMGPLYNIKRRCVAGCDSLEILAHYYSGPTGGYHSVNVTAKKVYEPGFYWPSVFMDANDVSHLIYLNGLAKLRDGAFENTRIYKEQTKKWHDYRLQDAKDFKVGDKVLLYNNRQKMYLGKHKSKWSG
nr:hypothetical protein [Tanacetum cinerariifolium]